MGSGSSRWKNISSGLQKEDHMYINKKERHGGNCSDPKEETCLYKSYKIQPLPDLTKPRSRSGLGCHSEGHDSDFSIDDEDSLDGEIDRVLAEYEGRDFYSSRKHKNNSFVRSNTYSFCNSRQVYKGSDFNSMTYIQKVDQMRTKKQPAFGLFGSMEVQHFDCDGTVLVSPWENNIVNNRDTCSQKMQRNDSLKQGRTNDLKNNNLTDTLHSSSENPSPILTRTPALYDDSEEELMSSIEREYS
ncbi:hypothetical protein AOXY_G6777 [Acipenser oxyrinchus oxyrinchus]|uniref:Uncharacterized protein n=1 Tax=Acipenser oxyrinchus oxyrinchus TaxID=40147 RepID=A0AAD8LQ78_ACIOX|nr:hypothetical protein AOXY_G6777 [Acipenser oxyrinchus oxyrinchus]